MEFDDVRFSYPSADKVSLASLEEVAVLSEADVRGGEEVLHGISFTAQPGEMVALVGSSGAGKSTIASLLARLYDVGAADAATSDTGSGSIKLNGVDVRDVTFASLKETVGMVTQDGHLFHETIASNLRLAAPDATDEELWQALERARLADVIAQMPDGLDTVVGERGYRLSGGQRQRLTIARLLLGRSRVVVLDEATASLDSASEAAVQQALGEASGGPDLDRDRPSPVHRARGRHDPRRRGRPYRRTRDPRPAAGARGPLRRVVRDPVRQAGTTRRCRSRVRPWKQPILICRLGDNWNYFD